jgi:hypothetical protein
MNLTQLYERRPCCGSVTPSGVGRPIASDQWKRPERACATIVAAQVFTRRRTFAEQQPLAIDLYQIEFLPASPKQGGPHKHPVDDTAATQQVLASLLRTAYQRGLDPTTTLVTLLRAPAAIVPPGLRQVTQ